MEPEVVCRACGKIETRPYKWNRSICRSCYSIKHAAERAAERKARPIRIHPPGIACRVCGKTEIQSHPGHGRICKPCAAKDRADRLKKNPEAIARQLANQRERRRELRATNKEWHENRKAGFRRRYQEVKDLVFTHYGGYRCACECGCGITEPGFLTIDHINNDGAEHRREKGPNLYQILYNEEYPKGFQVLCYNCNLGRAKKGGVCPSAEPKEET